MRIDWRIVVAVAVGGAIGSVARLCVGVFMQERYPQSFPIGTLAINIVGSFLLGVIAQTATTSPVFTPALRFFLTTGLCGGFTTFSTFSYETVKLVEEKRYAVAGSYMAGSVVLSIVACFAGVALARNALAARAVTQHT